MQMQPAAKTHNENTHNERVVERGMVRTSLTADEALVVVVVDEETGGEEGQQQQHANAVGSCIIITST